MAATHPRDRSPHERDGSRSGAQRRDPTVDAPPDSCQAYFLVCSAGHLQIASRRRAPTPRRA